MSQAIFTLSAFGDEIDKHLATQLDLLAKDGIFHLELRGAWGQNVLDLTPTELATAKDLLKEHGFKLSAIGSPVGKSALSQPREYEVERLDQAIQAAKVLDTHLIRIFSFYVTHEEAAAQRGEVLTRLKLLTEQAAKADMILVHENEKEIYGDTAERCLDIMTSINSPHLRMAFDPANFVQCGVHPMKDAWPLLAEYVTHVHIKDAVFADGTVRPAGEGDGAVGELLATLTANGYQGFLTLEPHLTVTNTSGQPDGGLSMRTACHALKGLLADLKNVQIK